MFYSLTPPSVQIMRKYYSGFRINPRSFFLSLVTFFLFSHSHWMLSRVMDWWTGIHFFILVPFFITEKINSIKKIEKNSKKFKNNLKFWWKKNNEDFEFREVETSEWKLGHVSPANHLSKRKENVLVIYQAESVADQLNLKFPVTSPVRTVRKLQWLVKFEVPRTGIHPKLGEGK